MNETTKLAAAIENIVKIGNKHNKKKLNFLIFSKFK
jgi:hypothetical protein